MQRFKNPLFAKPVEKVQIAIISYTVELSKFENTTPKLSILQTTKIPQQRSPAHQSGIAPEIIENISTTNNPTYCHTARSIASAAGGRNPLPNTIIKVIIKNNSFLI
ncbi:MAG: hypothetical protein HFE90_07310 [Firmicutes bacterium]|nr:hypothetical protein [Bacillota bacterium]